MGNAVGVCRPATKQLSDEAVVVKNWWRRVTLFVGTIMPRRPLPAQQCSKIIIEQLNVVSL